LINNTAVNRAVAVAMLQVPLMIYCRTTTMANYSQHCASVSKQYNLIPMLDLSRKRSSLLSIILGADRESMNSNGRVSGGTYVPVPSTGRAYHERFGVKSTKAEYSCTHDSQLL